VDTELIPVKKTSPAEIQTEHKDCTKAAFAAGIQIPAKSWTGSVPYRRIVQNRHVMFLRPLRESPEKPVWKQPGPDPARKDSIDNSNL